MEKSKKNRPGGDQHQKKVPLAMKPLTFVKEFGSVANNDETLDRRNIELNTIDMAPPQSCDSETIRKFSANKYKAAVMQNKKDNAGPSDFNASVNQFGRGTGQRKGQSPRGRMNVGRGVTTQKQKPLAVKGNHPLSDFLVVERAYTTQNSVSQLSQSAAFSHMPMTYTQSLNGREWFVSINGVNIGTGSGDTVKEAKEAAAANALETLSHHCYTLKVLKIHAANEEVTLSEVEAGKLGPSSSAPIEGASLDKPVDNSSMGMKLLKLMGWTGGGLGKEGSGIIEPIKPAEVFGREGLGRNKETDVSVQFNNGIKRLISDYARGTGFKEIAFTADFSKEQRASIHKVARRFRLKTVSYGKGDDRYLVLSRKYSNKALIHKLLENGPTDKYQLIPPKDK
ncbi:NF-kappa-B-repressing factor-like [Homarus americanus]|uniref:NF-kappa-B-repressing factor-like n=1 Tax=Homarus americanus TaxID=6706 RepID=A0A8J5MZ36_HOMAM|nr:NF-kappa-B-repressing factor-like [Homarus americanus]